MHHIYIYSFSGQNIPNQSICKLISLEPPLLYEVYAPQKAIFFCFNHPRARCQATRNHPNSPNQLKLFKRASPKPFTLPCRAFPAETAVNPGLRLPPYSGTRLLTSLALPRVALHDGQGLVSSTPECQKHLLPESPLCLLLWPHPTDQLTKECKPLLTIYL